ncbi:Putative acetyltransferase [Corynebacterium ciconiae DSM 44920]|uniref:sugar O-acetyltransferase n=1 Tax=Corynebacterium ciconiae TaxID=227319 RepID=UPI000371312C|nr:sugar O-acetyltransferase [Corynebacterium ciconiae]WKD60501.1 Putative acetyltransferase [Corynebacterium ciconiae DSM 44920]
MSENSFDPETYSTLEQMRSGQWYLPKSKEPKEARRTAARTLREFNTTTDEIKQQDLLLDLLGQYDTEDTEVESPIYIQYGVHTSIGKGSRIQANVTILDSAEVRIGERVNISPGCQLYTAMPPVHDAQMRSYGWKRALPITIEDDVWIGPGVTVLPGVTIGRKSVIAAGSVVDRDVPPHSIASGNPVQVTKGIHAGASAERNELPAGVPFDLGEAER